MGRAPCCDKESVKKGPWTPDEDLKLVTHIKRNGHGIWRALPQKAGLARCGKSCRLRWTNYLRPDIKRGRFSHEEEQTISQLHAILGNRWSAIASRLPRRTDNEIKNYWNTHLKKRTSTLKVGMNDLLMTHKIPTVSNPEALQPPSLRLRPSLVPARLTHTTQWDLTMRSWKTRIMATDPLRQTIKSGPSDPRDLPLSKGEAWNHDMGPSMVSGAARMGPGTVLGAACLDSVSSTEDSSLVTDGFRNEIISPTIIFCGPDSEGHTHADSPCGSTSGSDCFDFVPGIEQSSGYQKLFPAIPDEESEGSEPSLAGIFWEGQQAAMIEALKPDNHGSRDGCSGLQGDAAGIDHVDMGGESHGLESDIISTLDFDDAEFPQFESLLYSVKPEHNIKQIDVGIYEIVAGGMMHG